MVDFDEEVVIIGASFAGFSAAASLPKCSISIVDKAHAVGEGSPFRSSASSFSVSSSSRTNLGASIVSMNISEARLQNYLGKVMRSDETACILQHVDDGLLSKGKLSRTFDRPQGWNRVMGQWEHYFLATETCKEGKSTGISTFLTSLIGQREDVSVITDREVIGIEDVGGEAVGKKKKWKVITQGCSEDSSSFPNSIEATTVIICTPAEESLRLLR